MLIGRGCDTKSLYRDKRNYVEILHDFKVFLKQFFSILIVFYNNLDLNLYYLKKPYLE